MIPSSNEHRPDPEPRPRVLIAEDDRSYEPFWRSLLAEVHPDCAIDWVLSEEAAETFLLNGFRKGHPYNLVILDILLSGKATGIDLWRRFKEAGEHYLFVSHAPKSSYTDVWAKELAPPHFMEKPLSGAQCRQLVQSLLMNERRG